MVTVNSRALCPLIFHLQLSYENYTVEKETGSKEQNVRNILPQQNSFVPSSVGNATVLDTKQRQQLFLVTAHTK